ncbi:hypothetical protein I4U23_019241 [Adineta vaga]|nr:hypothetical protein I4U23_019241 [Adineta vaga]
MKSKQLYPKSVRPLSTNSSSSNNVNKPRVRCSLCDALLKASSNHRYLLSGKSAHDNLDKDLTYGQSFQRYLNTSDELDKLHMICLTCCQKLQRIHSIHKDAEQLTQKIRHSWYKTKRLNRTRHSRVTLSRINDSLSSCPLPTTATDIKMIISVKEELDTEDVPAIMTSSVEHVPITISNSVNANVPYDLSNKQQRIQPPILSLKIPHQTFDNHHAITNGKSFTQKKTPSVSKKQTSNSHIPKKSQLSHRTSSIVSTQKSGSTLPDGLEYYPTFVHQSISNNRVASPYTQLIIETPSPSSSSSSHQQQHIDTGRRNSTDSEQIRSTTNYEQSLDGDQSLSPPTNDDETSSINESKNTRLSRRQYDFLVKLADQQSLNAFIESSAAESGSRWTWRRTSANSRGYKVYYVCNFSMRRHYHPCPAAMYALFHPEGSISIYSCGEHQHIPKARLPVSITDTTKDEIFKCLQAGMATTDIREHLTRLQLPFGDTRKLNNFIKYHKELLRFGTVTNVRIGGTAYRQPQCWAIRRQPSVIVPSTVPITANDTNLAEGVAATSSSSSP